MAPEQIGRNRQSTKPRLRGFKREIKKTGKPREVDGLNKVGQSRELVHLLLDECAGATLTLPGILEDGGWDAVLVIPRQ